MGDELSKGCTFNCFLFVIDDEWFADNIAALIAPTTVDGYL